MKVLVSGLLNIETTVKIKQFPIHYYPIDYPFFGVNSNVSGVGFNLSGAFGKLGDKVELVSFLGNDDESERILMHLAKNGTSTDSISRTLKNTPVSVVLFDDEGKRQIYCDLKDIQEQTVNTDDITVMNKLESCDIAVLCNINFNRSLLQKAKTLHKIIATDVHVLSDIDDEYNKDFMSNADILFLSDEKLPTVPEKFIVDIAEKYGNQIIVIGMGGKGAMLYDNGNLYQLSAVQCQAVNTVGAGDALFASFLHYYGKGFVPLEALKRAECFAAIKIGYNGASVGFADEAAVENQLNSADLYIKKIISTDN